MIRTLVSRLQCCARKNQVNRDEASPRTVSIIVGFFFFVNFEMGGTGFLGIPFAFFHESVLAGGVTLLVIAFVNWITAVWMLEVLARAQV